ncbi:MAG: hypothetical protein ACJAWH_002313, partial [Maribacter sp.]
MSFSIQLLLSKRLQNPHKVTRFILFSSVNSNGFFIECKAKRKCVENLIIVIFIIKNQSC